MPPEIVEAIWEFLDAYHVETKFKKRRRDKLDLEEQKFGKEPIFLNRKRPANGGLDG